MSRLISFFRLLPMALAGLLLGCLASNPAGHSLQQFEFEQPHMGVPFRIVLYARDDVQARAGAEAAFNRIARLNSIMSDYETDSEISELSRSSEQGSPAVPVSPDLWNVLSAAQQLAVETGGAFDVTVGPCAALWRKARREKSFPDAARLENARRKTGYTNLVLNSTDRTARLSRFGMRLDLGGIAKGYAADEALKSLRELGLPSALVAASGDLALGDPPPGKRGWTVEIVGYHQPGGPPAGFAELANCAIATSGDLFQRLEIDGVRYSHILNPFTCVGMTNQALATVIARSGTIADALATSCTILDPSQALELARKYDAAVRIVVLENNTPFLSANQKFQSLVAPVLESHRH